MDLIIDIETDGIEATKIHCMSIHGLKTLTCYAEMSLLLASLTEEDRIIGHNFIRYDKPVLERILSINIKASVVDTLALSWYLYPTKVRHGLAVWGEFFSIKKPEISDWENGCVCEYIHRCEEDVRINHKLWVMQSKKLNKLYDRKQGGVDRLIKYLAYKMNCAAMQEHNKWKLDVQGAEALLLMLQSKYDVAVGDMAKSMPKVPQKAKRSAPAKPFKKDGTLSTSGENWNALCVEHNKPSGYVGVIEVIVKHQDPNPSSTPQVKDWLTSLGWKPITFKFRKSDNKSISQIRKPDGDLCKSIELLIEKHAELKHLVDMTVVKHRIGMVKGLLDNADEDGFVKATIQGFTNTLRFKHAVCVNIPSIRKPYGKEIRELLTVRGDDYILCGSDMASLEDRTKQHYMWDHDPDYVTAMTDPGFDPHLDLALSAKAVTEEQVASYKGGDKTSQVTQIRHNYKGGNYACTYGAGIGALQKQLGIGEIEANRIHKAYWRRNWSLKEIASGVEVKEMVCELQDIQTIWLFNPVSGLFYYLKSNKDRFSTLNQGTATYCFDTWVAFITKERPQLTAQFHDEVILELKKDKQNEIKNLLKSSIHKVNKVLRLNRDLDCDISFGKDYSQVH